ncbi:hypothetical protein LX73_0983 [Fodinibius salinus]|uniref:Carboxypeptidase regulatory-like domain-containing protein n=1 Tax=Fodinibius salinus TaxID=860790 RepID=A0A5D3YQS4_9BACT|nr:hypothetical protein [Fodinibius salinus]TYP95668.1 hypothetical protein LX73_0983 [Fodinibius salinus]
MATVWLLLAISPSVYGQQSSSNPAEVYLTFQYRGVVSSYITSYYKDKHFYLPASDIFKQLKIQHEVNNGELTISGNYLSNTPFSLNFKKQIARAGDTRIQLTADDFIIKEIDYFLKPEVFKKMFGLEFTTNFNSLTLDLQTNDKMPVMAQYEREQKRKRIDRQQPLYNQPHYPLKYKRNYSTLNGAFLDYNFSAIHTDNSQLFTFNNSMGAELLGGDIQGTVFGSISDQQRSFTTSNLRWRYVQRNNNYFSSGIVGQTTTEGIISRQITGVKISNKPVESRRLFDRYVIDGNVTPQSEVELYLNNRLVDYQEADQSGNYRFVVPLAYGSTDYSVRIFKPSGRSTERSTHIQIPFDFVPSGEIDYNISGGRLNNPILGTTERGFAGAASAATGLTEWLTAGVSSEYLSEFNSGAPSFTGTINARLFSNYLVSANINSENFYRFSSSVIYGNGASWNLTYDYNPGNNRLYNVGGNDHRVSANLFTPLNIGDFPLNIRWSSTYQEDNLSSLWRYRTDVNTRLGRLNIRLGYQDQQRDGFLLTPTSAARLTNSYTYSVGRSYHIPAFIRGMFLRAKWTYIPSLSKVEETELQLSQNLLETGRLQLTFGHNFIGDFNSLSLNVTLNFNKVRSNTSARVTGSRSSITQNISGSVGYHSDADQLLFHNRQQVGQSGTAVQLFVDNNNDGSYQDSTDRIIDDAAVSLKRASGRTTIKNGVNYISQLLPYYRYDMEINRGNLSNPLLVPNTDKFSIVTDPNQYKTVAIPFYQSGVISGKVEQKKDSTAKSLSGVRLFLESNYKDSSNRNSFSKTIRTFSDGSFYAYEIPPGRYDLYIDREQLSFLKSKSSPDTMTVNIEPLAEGDFVENLGFTVIPLSADTAKSEPLITASDDSNSDAAKDSSTTDPKITEKSNKTSVSDNKHANESDATTYSVQLASFRTLENSQSAADNASKTLQDSFSVVRNTLNGYFAIRGTANYSLEKAINTATAYHKNFDYNSTAVLIKKPKLPDSQQVPPVFIQLGADFSFQQGQKFANNAQKNLSHKIGLTYDKPSKIYRTYIDSSFSSADKRKALLEEIRNNTSYTDAFIHIRRPTTTENSGNGQQMHFTFKIRVEEAGSSFKQESVPSLKKNNPQLSIEESGESTVIISDFNTWKQAEQLYQQLKETKAAAVPVLLLIQR